MEPKRSEFEQISNNEFVIRPGNYTGPIAIDATPSPEMKEYHKNFKIQVNLPRNFEFPGETDESGKSAG